MSGDVVPVIDETIDLIADCVTSIREEPTASRKDSQNGVDFTDAISGSDLRVGT